LINRRIRKRKLAIFVRFKKRRSWRIHNLKDRMLMIRKMWLKSLKRLNNKKKKMERS